MINKLALSGQMLAGKDYVAKAAGFEIIGFADPIYKIITALTGIEVTPNKNKDIPGIRKLMQQIGQWGRGYIDSSPEYSVTAERAHFTYLMRTQGHNMLGGEYCNLTIKWKDFGQDDNFWVNILLQRVERMFYYAQRYNSPTPRIAVTNVRFGPELEPLKAAGFDHYHVMCSQITRSERAGGNVPSDDDPSESLAKRLNMEMPADRIIWNDNDRDFACSYRDGRGPVLSIEDFARVANDLTKELSRGQYTFITDDKSRLVPVWL